MYYLKSSFTEKLNKAHFCGLWFLDLIFLEIKKHQGTLYNHGGTVQLSRSTNKKKSTETFSDQVLFDFE